MDSHVPKRSKAKSLVNPLSGGAPWGCALFLTVATTIAYSNSFNAAFHFDDHIRIEENFGIRSLWPISAAMENTTRPLGMTTFAINYAVHGYDVWGYHATNLVIHIAAGLTLFGIVRRTLLRGRLAQKYCLNATPLAFVVALIWTVHPLNTESVTYIVQRLESLMGFFYLATLYCFIRAQDSRWKPSWYAASIVCCAMGMGTKEVMVTAPVMVLWYDRVFVADSWRKLWQDRWSYYACLVSTWGLLVWCMLRYQEDFENGLIGAVSGLTPLSYLFSESSVITHYLRLSLWPFGQCLDYGWPVTRTAEEVLPTLILVGALFLTTIWAIFRHPEWAFLGGWFFVLLAPTSSVVPIVDLAFEHRMYLSLAAVIAAAVFAANGAMNRMGSRCGLSLRGLSLLKGSLAAIVVAQMAVLTWGRNEVYQSEIGLWEDTVRQAPMNARAHGNLAAALRLHGRLDESFEHCRQAIEIAPNSADAQTDYGVVLAERGDVKASVIHHRKALDLKPNNPHVHCNLAISLWKLDLRKEAMRHFERAEQLAPANADIRKDFAKTIAESGLTDQALKYYQIALQIRPNDPSIYYNIGVALQDAGRLDESAGYYREAIRLSPDLAQAHNNLGIVLIASGKATDAIIHFTKAIELAPGLAVAHQNLGNALAEQGQIAKAIDQLQQALEIQPGLNRAAEQLEKLRKKLKP